MGVMRALVVVAWLACLAGAPGAARAGDPSRARARQLFEAGMRDYNLGRLQRALKSFEEGYVAKPDPAFLFNVGQCHRMLGNHEQAVYAYQRYLSAAPDAPNRREVESLIQKEEAALQRQEAAVAPTGTLAPREDAKPAPATPERAAKESAPPPAPSPTADGNPIVAAPVPAEAPPAASTPVYKKWWLWTIAGVVVVGAGAGVGVAYALPNNASVPAMDAASIPINF